MNKPAFFRNIGRAYLVYLNNNNKKKLWNLYELVGMHSVANERQLAEMLRNDRINRKKTISVPSHLNCT
jgi:hypothetical protein